MRSPFATLQEFTIPAGAGSGTPRTYFGRRVPTDLAAFYAAQSRTIISAIINFNALDDYFYEVELVGAGPGGGPARARGARIAPFGVVESSIEYWDTDTLVASMDLLTIGDLLAADTIRANLYQVPAGGTLEVEAGGELIVDSGGFQSVYGDAKVYSGGRLIIDGGGGELQIQSGGLVTMGGKTISGGPVIYNPTTTNFIKNNGSLTAKYKYLDEHHVRTWGRLDVGSSTVFGGGDINISLPVTPFVAPGGLGTFLAIDASANQSYPGVTALFGSIMFMVAKNNNWSGSNPFVPAAGDVYLWDIIYEV